MKWLCDCDAENHDEPEDTAVPICGNCGKEWFWIEIERRIEDAQRQQRMFA